MRETLYLREATTVNLQVESRVKKDFAAVIEWRFEPRYAGDLAHGDKMLEDFMASKTTYRTVMSI